MKDDVKLTCKSDHLYDIIKTDTFLEMHALGGEIPFFITTFTPVQQVKVDSCINALKNKLNTNGVPVLELNLFDICLDILQMRNLLEKTIEMEPTVPKERLLNMLRMPLDVEHNFIPEIARRINSFDGKVVILTGIGLVFPYIRSHTILNNLPSTIKIPMVMFFPGSYDGHSLTLFGRLKDDNYYRAFILDDINM